MIALLRRTRAKIAWLDRSAKRSHSADPTLAARA
jgi:hypothetical protein